MHHYRTVVVPEHKIEELEKTTCDFCNEIILRGDEATSSESIEINSSNFDFKDPNSEKYRFISYDMCPKCFHDKLVPWAKSLGVDPRIQNS
jgi:hypothetical protein